MEIFQHLNDNHHKNTVNQYLGQRFSELVLNYLKWEIKFLFYDYINLEKSLSGNYNDYSFSIAPAYKAFEGFLFQLGIDLKLFDKNNLPYSPGSFYEDEKIEKSLQDLFKGVLNLTKKVDKDKFKDISGRISEMRNLLRRYRHTPAHYQGSQCIPNFAKAKDYAASIIFNMNDLIKLLDEVNILKPEQMQGL